MALSRVQTLLEAYCGREELVLRLKIRFKIKKKLGQSPRAVPQEVVASDPVLHIVIMVNFFSGSDERLNICKTSSW